MTTEQEITNTAQEMTQEARDIAMRALMNANGTPQAPRVPNTFKDDYDSAALFHTVFLAVHPELSISEGQMLAELSMALEPYGTVARVWPLFQKMLATDGSITLADGVYNGIGTAQQLNEWVDSQNAETTETPVTTESDEDILKSIESAGANV